MSNRLFSVTLILFCIQLNMQLSAQKSIYKEGWIDFNKNGLVHDKNYIAI
jgi:fumarate reductase subunit C